MQEKRLEDMEGEEIAGLIDNAIEQLERQLGPEDVLAVQTLGRLKAEARRRIMRQSPVEAGKVVIPITVEVKKIDLDKIIPPGGVRAHFHGTPYLVTLVGMIIGIGEQIYRHGFLSTAEVEAFLTGLVTAREFGLRFKEIPDVEHISDKEPADSGGTG